MSTMVEMVDGSICDTALVSEAKTGNHHAFEELCRRYSSTLMKSIRRVLRDHWDAEEALQETLLSAYTHLRGFEGQSSVLTWMTRIAINAALSRVRRKRPPTLSIDEIQEETGLTLSSVLQADTPDAECQLIQTQQEELLARAIVRLPPQLRTVIELRIKNGCSSKEIADKLDISVAAVKSRIWRACRRLGEYDAIRTHAYEHA